MTSDELARLTQAVEKLSKGDLTPSGFEALVMAIRGNGVPGDSANIVAAIDRHAKQMERIANALYMIAGK